MIFGVVLTNEKERSEKIMEIFIVVNEKAVDVKKNVETAASKVVAANTASLLDACTCTGNCC